MKHHLFRPLATAFCTALLLGGLSLPAQAAGEITVRVDDQAVSFTDAYPLLRDDRTYVPFRAIFEQMDASVSWDGATQTVTAVRDGRTVVFQIGQTDIQITEDGQSHTVSTDAAPFIEGSRTYVPVRFASESFGACVDWVQSTQTVLIVDVDSLIDQAYADAFGYMDAYLQLAGQDGTRTGSFTLSGQYQAAMGSLPIQLSGSAAGQSSAGADALSGAMQLDTAAIQAAIATNEGTEVIDSRIQALLDSLSNSSYEAIFSRTDRALYLSGALATELGAEADGWLAIPFDVLAGQTAGSLLAAPAYDSFAEYAASLAQQLDLEAAPDTTVQTVRTFLEGVRSSYGDQAFTRSDTQATLTNSDCNLALTYTGETLTQAELSCSAQENGVSYTASARHASTGLQLQLSRTDSAGSSLSFSISLDATPGESSPAVRPSGDVTDWQ